MTETGEVKIKFSFKKNIENGFQRRITDQEATPKKLSSQKLDAIHFERKNLLLSGEGGTCHLITQRVSFSDTLADPNVESSTAASGLSLGFQSSILRLKFTPFMANAPFWVQGNFEKRILPMDSKHNNFGRHRAAPEPKPFQIIFFDKPLEFIGASLEACLVMKEPQSGL